MTLQQQSEHGDRLSLTRAKEFGIQTSLSAEKRASAGNRFALQCGLCISLLCPSFSADLLWCFLLTTMLTQLPCHLAHIGL